MKNSNSMRKLRRLVVFCAVFCFLVALPLMSNALSATSVNIVNNSSRQIAYVYLSPVNAENWSGDQLGEADIAPGQSFTLSNLACDQQQIKVIGEDSDGCFLSVVIDCGTNPTWTITNSATADCGGD